jgi:hypothetical protein
MTMKIVGKYVLFSTPDSSNASRLNRIIILLAVLILVSSAHLFGQAKTRAEEIEQ